MARLRRGRAAPQQSPMRCSVKTRHVSSREQFIDPHASAPNGWRNVSTVICASRHRIWKAILARKILAKLILRTATSIVLLLTYDPAILQRRRREGHPVTRCAFDPGSAFTRGISHCLREGHELLVWELQVRRASDSDRSPKTVASPSEAQERIDVSGR